MPLPPQNFCQASFTNRAETSSTEMGATQLCRERRELGPNGALIADFEAGPEAMRRSEKFTTSGRRSRRNARLQARV